MESELLSGKMKRAGFLAAVLGASSFLFGSKRKEETCQNKKRALTDNELRIGHEESVFRLSPGGQIVLLKNPTKNAIDYPIGV